MTLYRVSAQSLEVLSASAASLRTSAQSLEVLVGTYQLRLPKAYGLVVLGPNPAAVAVQKTYALAVLDDGSVPSYDAYFSNVVLLLHGDGSNGSTVITDSSTSAKTVTAIGNAAISTAQAKFGQSIAFDGTGDYLTVPDSDDFAFGSGPFTVECWYRPTSTNSGNIALMGQWGSGAGTENGWYFWGNGGQFGIRLVNTSESTIDVQAAKTFTVGQWYHLAVDRDASNTFRVYIDGAVHASGTYSWALKNSTSPLFIGRISNSFTTYDLNGHLDDIRLTKGTARYGGAFAVPQAAYPDTGTPVVTASRRRPVVALLG